MSSVPISVYILFSLVNVGRGEKKISLANTRPPPPAMRGSAAESRRATAGALPMPSPNPFPLLPNVLRVSWCSSLLQKINIIIPILLLPISLQALA